MTHPWESKATCIFSHRYAPVCDAVDKGHSGTVTLHANKLTVMYLC